jgi:hypothetical protein
MGGVCKANAEGNTTFDGYRVIVGCFLITSGLLGIRPLLKVLTLDVVSFFLQAYNPKAIKINEN